MGIFQNNLLAGAAAAASAGGGGFYDHQIAQSARFDSGSSSYLTKTFSGAGNRRTGTISFWCKRSSLGTQQTIFNPHISNGEQDQLATFQPNNTLAFFINGANSGDVNTAGVFRDVSGWNHIMQVWDTTQGTASNRVKVYFNGSQVTSLTNNSGGTVSYPSQNYQLAAFGANVHAIGRRTASTGDYFNGYLAEVVGIDGTAQAPTDLGEFKNDVWIPKDPSGLTFGTNGFHLKFENASDLGNDSSGNNNDFTANAMGTDHQSIDTPTIGTG